MSGQAHHHYTGDIGGCYYPDIWGLHGIAVSHYKDQLSNNQAHHLCFFFFGGGGWVLKMFPKQKHLSIPSPLSEVERNMGRCSVNASIRFRGTPFRNGGPQQEALMVHFKCEILSKWMWIFGISILHFKLVDADVGERDLSYSHLFSAARSFSPVATTRSTKHACKCHSLWELSWGKSKCKIKPEQLHPWRLTWNLIMEVWKISFLSTWVTFWLHVNLPGCIQKGHSTLATRKNVKGEVKTAA